MRRLAQVMACVVHLVMAHQVRAQQGSGWLGQRVITRFGTPLKVGRQVVDEGKPDARSKSGALRVYCVARVQGPWLWLVPEQEGKSGLAKAAQVVPYDKAIDYFTREIERDPANSGLYLARALGWELKREYAKAIAAYTEAIRLDPKKALYYSNRASAWAEKGDLDQAIADLNEAIRLEPRRVRAYFNRAKVWRAKEEPAKAIADFNEVIRLDPESDFADEARREAQILKLLQDGVEPKYGSRRSRQPLQRHGQA